MDAVVFDAVSTGNRVHVFEFAASSSTSSIGALANEVFRAETPGFRAFASDPDAVAAMLDPLIETARAAVPAHVRHQICKIELCVRLALAPKCPGASDGARWPTVLAAAKAVAKPRPFACDA